jgi:multiple sugar transport system substrate-binding protein
MPRPPHPAYATISSAFNEAITTIVDGGDVQGALDEAVEVIDEDIEDNDGYPEP